MNAAKVVNVDTVSQEGNVIRVLQPVNNVNETSLVEFHNDFTTQVIVFCACTSSRRGLVLAANVFYRSSCQGAGHKIIN